MWLKRQLLLFPGGNPSGTADVVGAMNLDGDAKMTIAIAASDLETDDGDWAMLVDIPRGWRWQSGSGMALNGDADGDATSFFV